jgi:5-methylcytosine rRNA methyltransferase NSUN4
MSKKNKRLKGPEAFELFYSEIYGDRWNDLKESLLASKNHVAVANPYGINKLKQSWPFGPGVFVQDEKFTSPEGEPRNYYLMDGASALAPLSLQVQKGEKVLDLCAAPGGKSLILAYALNGNGELVVNDRSLNRRQRLKRVIEEYIPLESRSNIQVTGHDAGEWCLHQQEVYDKILLDAPCSSERHLLNNPAKVKDWAPGRTKRLGKEQWRMLASAFLVLKKGGFMVYSTCSLSPLENDDVVEKLINKYDSQIELIEFPFDVGEKTNFGQILLPDHCDWGPLYISLIQKKL